MLPQVVWLRLNGTALCVNWVDMPLFQDSRVLPDGEIVYTFVMCLYEGGAVRWSFSNFTSPPSDKDWMVGGCVCVHMRMCVYMVCVCVAVCTCLCVCV